MGITRRAFIGAALGISMLGLTGCGKKPPEGVQPNEPATVQTQEEGDPVPLAVTESGYYVDQIGGIHYAAIIENANTNWAAERISVSVAARDASGNVIQTSSDMITFLFANGRAAVTGSMTPNSPFDHLEFTLSVPSGGWTKDDTQMSSFTDGMPITGLNESWDEYGTTLTVAGEISNNLGGTFSGTSIQVIFRAADGSVVGGAYTYPSGELSPGSTLPFSVPVFSAPEHASVEAYVDFGWPAVQQ